MADRFEGHFSGYDKAELFYQTWQPQRVRGVVILTHGLAEHGECYGEVANALNADGWLVYAWDMRGHGRSSGKRGYAKNLGEFTADLGEFCALVQKTNPGLPLVLFGHSLGGLVTLLFAQQKKPAVEAIALSSPALGLSLAVSKFKQTLAEVAQRWLPTLTLSNEIDYHNLTRDPLKAESFRQDALRHDKISPGIFLGMLEAFPRALTDAGRIEKPILLQVGTDDRIVDVPAAKAMFVALASKQKKMIEYPGSFHEIFNDLDRSTVIADLQTFLAPFRREEPRNEI